PIDEVNDGDRRIAGKFLQKAPVAVRLYGRRNSVEHAAHGAADGLGFAKGVGIETGAARIADLLLALGNLEQGLRNGAPRAEQVDLKEAHVAAILRVVFQVMPQ